FSKGEKGSKLYKLLFIALVGIAMSLFHLYTSGFGVFEAWQQRMITLSFVLLLIPVLFHFSSKNSLIGKIADVTYLFLTIMVVIYSLQAYPDIAFRTTIPNEADVFFGSIAVILVLEGTRRAIGYFLSILIFLF